MSGCDSDRQQLRSPDFLRYGLPVSNEASDVDLDGFGCALPALFEGVAVSQTSRQRGHRHDEVSGLVRLDHDGVRTHCSILSQDSSELIARHTCLGKDRAEQARPDRLSCMQRNGDASTAARVFQVGMRSLLRDDYPTRSTEGLHDLPASDSR